MQVASKSGPGGERWMANKSDDFGTTQNVAWSGEQHLVKKLAF